MKFDIFFRDSYRPYQKNRRVFRDFLLSLWRVWLLLISERSANNFQETNISEQNVDLIKYIFLYKICLGLFVFCFVVIFFSNYSMWTIIRIIFLWKLYIWQNITETCALVCCKLHSNFSGFKCLRLLFLENNCIFTKCLKYWNSIPLTNSIQLIRFFRTKSSKDI